jgi:sulfur-carrier protein
MAIEVRIPTILRNYTGGAKSVEGSGDTLAGLITSQTGVLPGNAGLVPTETGARRRPICRS